MRSREYKYFLTGLGIYILAVLYLHFFFEQPLRDFLTVFLIPGAGFSLIAWRLLKDQRIASNRSAIKNEVAVLIILLAWIIGYITRGAVFFNQLIPDGWIENKMINSLIITTRKLLVFVVGSMVGIQVL